MNSPNIKFVGETNPIAVLIFAGAKGKIAKIKKIAAVKIQKTAYFSLSTDLLSNSTTKTIKINEDATKKA